MRLLLDTHVFVWAKSAPDNLREEAVAAIVDPDNEAFISLASAWELWIKNAKKPIAGFGPVLDSGAAGFHAAARESGIELLGIHLEHIAKVAVLPPVHRDPFDRMLIAQALVENLTIVTKDPAFKRYPGVHLMKA